MRGSDERSGSLFSYVDLEARVRVDHPVAVCPPQDQRKSLQYEWDSGVCTNTITVRWSSDDHNIVTLLDGYYYAACL